MLTFIAKNKLGFMRKSLFIKKSKRENCFLVEFIISLYLLLWNTN